MSTSNDGSESVDQFLARIASIKEPRDPASEEKTKRMEEDFVKNRKERQARRLERARSLSPSKTGPARPTSISSSPAPLRETILNPPVDFSPRTSVLSRSNAVSARTSPILEPKQQEIETPSSAPSTSRSTFTNATGLSRSSTLSWQQRPSTRDGGGSRPRPLSTIATVRTVGRDEEPPSRDQEEPTRKEIAASLGLKDPAWFRQTQERGANSAAYRKNQVEDTPEMNLTAQSMRLPGLSRDGTTASEDTKTTPTKPNVNKDRPLPTKPTSLKTAPKAQLTSDTPILEPSPSPAQASTPVGNDTIVEKSPENVMSAAARSPSPTKGLGGFVQSAMMKRSDSVSKRWSVQSNTGLKRGDSVAGVRPLSIHKPVQSPVVTQESPAAQRAVPDSPITTARSTPSQGDARPVAGSSENRKQKPANEEDPGVPPMKSATQETQARPQTPPTNINLDRSPSKTMDSRRWSPTKSSWLESTLLSKPEPPKMTPKKEEQPQWMVNLQRTKSTREQSPDKSSIETRPESVKLSTIQRATPPKNIKPSTFSTHASKVAPAKPQKPTQDSIDVPLSTTKAMKASVVTKPEDVGVPEKSDLSAESNSLKDSVLAAGTDESKNSELPDTKINKKPPALKPKPQTPPKTDFRATLRTRAPPSSDNDNAEPEFRSMFGKLRSAQTKNYVAPDEFKTNILSGKAALSITGGPQKTQRVDEFKESIQQKKEAMQAIAEQKKQGPAPKADLPKSETPLPEALARRKTLHRATPSITKAQEEWNSATPSVAVTLRPTTIAKTAKPGGSPATSSPSPMVAPRTPSPSKAKKNEDAEDKSASVATATQPVKQITLQRKPSDPGLTSDQNANVSSLGKVTQSSQQSSQQALLTSSKLASRLNPNLAALLSHGGGPRSPVNSPPADDVLKSLQVDPTLVNSGEKKAAELTHATKARAKGPKRRAPKSQPTAERPVADQSFQMSASGKVNNTSESVKIGTTEASTANRDLGRGPSSTSDKVSPTVKSATTQIDRPVPVTAVQGSTPAEPTSASSNVLKTKPTVMAKSPELRRVSSSLNQKTNDITPPRPEIAKHFDIATDQKSTAASVTHSPVSSQFGMSPKPQPKALPLMPNKTRLNTPRQPRVENDSNEKLSSSKLSDGVGLGVEHNTLKSASPVPSRQSTPAPVATRSPPADKAQSSQAAAVGVAELLSSHFASLPSASDKMEFDIHALLVKKDTARPKLKTISKTIWEITGDGKKSSMPPQQEHILYEDSLYLIVHEFESASGTAVTSEVYLWSGDRVSEATIEDTQLFCRKDAREHSTKLEVIRQGQEPAKFFQALGDIVIIRRSKASALYMLCGRRHMGYLAFDETEYSADSLCPGFVYLISAKFGKLYLWKGKGSAADELGCARLIGMDLGLTGEIEEIDEGAEPPSFWEAFGQEARKQLWASDWSQRSKHDAYPCALYRIEQDRPKSSGGFWGLRSTSPTKSSNKAVVESVEPICHRDLDSANMYVLDAYRSVYVLLGSKAASKKAEFITALHLAQEVAMLSPSIQNRSLMPSCYVVFGTLPADVKACFRKWPHVSKETNEKVSVCVKLEDVMQALGL